MALLQGGTAAFNNLCQGQLGPQDAVKVRKGYGLRGMHSGTPQQPRCHDGIPQGAVPLRKGVQENNRFCAVSREAL
jgi:hypothetical protein